MTIKVQKDSRNCLVRRPNVVGLCISRHPGQKHAKALAMNRTAYIEFLKQEFTYRRMKNFFYSLRDFAFDLELRPDHLSRILNNERGLSREKAETIARKLHLKYEERRKFIFLVSAVSSRSKFKKNLARMGLRNDRLRKNLRRR